MPARFNGVDIDQQIREKSKGIIWMENTDDYSGLSKKQKFIDNSFGEKRPFTNTPCAVLRGRGADYRKRRTSESLRNNGDEVDARIREQSGCLKWMVNPSDYRGMNRKQAFVDNEYGEEALFTARPGSVLYRDHGSPKYRARRLGDALRHSGIDIANKIVKQTHGLIWMQDPSVYRGYKYKQTFIDNSYGEALPFISSPGAVIAGNGSAYPYRNAGDALRHSGLDIDRRIREASGGVVWMQNPTYYRGVNYKQEFIDNSYGEKLAFISTPGFVLYRGQRARKYRGRRGGDSNRKYTRKAIIETIGLCKELHELIEKYPGVYLASVKQSDYKILVSGLTRRGGTHSRFTYRVTDDVLVYYGITGNPKKRESQHRERGNAKKILDSGGRFEVISDLLPVDDAREKEIFLIANPENSSVSGLPLICVNKLKGGELGGTTIKWNKISVMDAALLCKSKSEFISRYAGAYDSAHKNGWIDEVCSHMERPVNEFKWDLCSIKDVASLCASRSEFKSKYTGAYRAAIKKNWIDEACSHMKSSRESWTKEKVKALADECQTRGEFEKRFKKAYQTAVRMGWLKEVCSHMAYANQSWSLEDVKQCANQCEYKKEFEDGFNRAYQAALRNGWMKTICSHMASSVVEWDLEKVKNLSKKCSVRGEFAKRFPNAYAAAQRHGWTDEVCAHMKPIRESWAKDKIMDVALRCNSRSEFKKLYGGAYHAGKRGGWLDEVCSHMMNPLRGKSLKYETLSQQEMPLACSA